ncbi:Vacuolar sorting protein VPS45 [Klebsormidium nitens]|uniref:Vacuolar sorting protein VPS45 n=1 Tax=Klebsormidium nitens TaxID=105231 RepID=A0A0U9HKB1_KLENI|nr:Vacuolar sorting protein VPS45 [Klebsormidium nitens]|eukprot:GAQ82505.1 Vacuolar sorting protein VPS45 [Klebsormidium nitens]
MATEVVHRVAEILKLFNSRSCQLVLGAGAMQVSGLKSITAKHLATASQGISLYIALIPDIRRLLSAHIPDARKALLLSEVDRVVNDYRVHRDEIHSKLVAIMRERLQVHLKVLPQLAEHWSKPDDRDAEPSKFATDLAREVGILYKVLLPFLTDAELRSIFTRVVILFHTQLTEAFSKVDASTPPAKRRLYRDVKHLLEGISILPIMPSMVGKPKDLDTFMLHRFGNQPPP